MIRFLLLFISLQLSVNSLMAQCAEPTLITNTTINDISIPFQLTFLHRVPKNKVDSAVAILADPNIKTLYDDSKIVENIGKDKSKEGFWTLYLACLGPNVYDDMTLFGYFCGRVQANGGLRVLNDYYLKPKVKEDINKPNEFRAEVLKRCAAKVPKLYYCQELNQAVTVEALQQAIDTLFSEYVHCNNPILVTDANMESIHNPYELTFLNKIPQNFTDSAVAKLLTHSFSTAKEAVDYIDSLAACKTEESFKFLYLCCVLSPYKNIMHSQLQGLANQLVSWGSFRAINKYYFNNEVSTDQHELPFRTEIIRRLKPLRPTIYYCHQPTIMELYKKEMADINPKPYDRKIIRIIRKYSNTKKPGQIAKLVKAVQQLPFVEEVLWDGCYDKLCIYPEYYSLMVSMNVGGKQIERYYSMNGARFMFLGIRWKDKFWFGRSIETNKHKLTLKGYGYSPGALKAAKDYCEQRPVNDAVDETTEE